MRRTSVRSLWAGQGRAFAWLTGSVGLTVVLGLVLQLLAIRRLESDEYATFIFALGIGNIAAAIAGAIQPVVAARVLDGGRGGAMPASPALTAAIAAAISMGAAAALIPWAGAAASVLAVAQVPLHCVVAAGLGRLQGSQRYGSLALGYACFAVVRLGFAVAVLAAGSAGEMAFVASLPAGLAATIALLASAGAYRREDFHPARDRGALFAAYATWGAAAWLLNADAVFARVVLDGAEAGRYALAVTLGRQASYAVIPLLFILLPAARRAEGDQVQRLRALFLVSGALLLVSLGVLFPAPGDLATLLTWDDGGGHSALIRGYAVAGPLGALASLLATFVYGAGGRLPGWPIAGLAAASLTVPLLAHSGGVLLASQGALLGALTLVLAVAGMRVARRLSAA